MAVKLDTVVEPSFVTLGPFHMAVGINDRTWIYDIREHGISVCIHTQCTVMWMNVMHVR